MGFFSWKCCVSGESIASHYAEKAPEHSDCYLVLPDRVIHEPKYEGYGDFSGQDVYAILGNGDRRKGIDIGLNKNHPDHEKILIKIVKARYYKGQKYEDLPASEECPEQGFFYPDRCEKILGVDGADINTLKTTILAQQHSQN